MRRGSARLPSHRYRSKVRYRTVPDYGPGICIRVRIPYRTVRIRILILHWRIKIKLLSARIRVHLLKNQSFFLLRFTESPDPRMADPGLGSGPKSGSGLNRWHQSGETDPWLFAGSDPDCVTTNRDRDTTYVGTGPDQLPLAKDGKKKGQFY